MATKTGVRYRRVAQNEEEMEERKRKRDAAVDQISTKIQAMFWVSLAAIVVYMTDLPRTVIESEKIDRVYLNISIVCLVINSCLVFYLTVWLPYVQKVTLSWEVYCPRVIPTVTVVGILFFFTVLKALWPAYGFLSPLIVLVLFMGFLFSTHFIPAWC
mmetsp:Transcript_36247/g.83895  ORF Transcript_36247/g.83895 Transcript_36247/m.83895 type:complete len:158 (+) Transcript_36247:121-594(+)